jgi:predicted nucleotidyltransferase
MINDETLLKVRQKLVDGFAPTRIILFGSQARGTADERSDVDILVVC